MTRGHKANKSIAKWHKLKKVCTFLAFYLHMSNIFCNFAPAKLWAWASEWG